MLWHASVRAPWRNFSWTNENHKLKPPQEKRDYANTESTFPSIRGLHRLPASLFVSVARTHRGTTNHQTADQRDKSPVRASARWHEKQTERKAMARGGGLEWVRRNANLVIYWFKSVILCLEHFSGRPIRKLVTWKTANAPLLTVGSTTRHTGPYTQEYPAWSVGCSNSTKRVISSSERARTHNTVQ